MEWQEIIKYVEQNIKHYVIENDNIIMLISDFIVINDVLTIDNVSIIQFVSDGQVWINNNMHIDIKDIKKISIYKY